MVEDSCSVIFSFFVSFMVCVLSEFLTVKNVKKVCVMVCKLLFSIISNERHGAEANNSLGVRVAICAWALYLFYFFAFNAHN